MMGELIDLTLVRLERSLYSSSCPDEAAVISGLIDLYLAGDVEVDMQDGELLFRVTGAQREGLFSAVEGPAA